MKMRYNSGLTYTVMWLSLACLLFSLSLPTTITAKPTIDEIGTRMTSKNTTNETYPLIMCPLMKCRWDFEIDAVTGCQTCRDPCSGVVCPENETCVPIIVQCFVAPCLPMGFCEKITSSSII